MNTVTRLLSLLLVSLALIACDEADYSGPTVIGGEDVTTDEGALCDGEVLWCRCTTLRDGQVMCLDVDCNRCEDMIPDGVRPRYGVTANAYGPHECGVEMTGHVAAACVEDHVTCDATGCHLN